MEYVIDRIENIVGKGENGGFLLFPQCFQKAFSSDSLKPGITWYKLVNPLLDDKSLDLSKLKQIADYILKCI